MKIPKRPSPSTLVFIAVVLGFAVVLWWRGPHGTAWRYSSWRAVDCGTTEPMDRQGHLNQTACVEEARAAGRPFKLVQYRMGIDSTVAAIFVSTGGGRVRAFAYDSDITGAGGLGPSRTTEIPCTSTSTDAFGELVCGP